MMFGLVIGLAAGAVQVFLLAKFTRMVTSGNFSASGVLYGFFRFFFTPVVLVCTAIFHREGLLYAGLGAVAALLGCALIAFLFSWRKEYRKGGLS